MSIGYQLSLQPPFFPSIWQMDLKLIIAIKLVMVI